jgi:hypothetical protein
VVNEQNMARFTFFVAGGRHEMMRIRETMSIHNVTPLHDCHGLALMDSLPGAVRSASHQGEVTHAVWLFVEPSMLLDMFMEGFATRSFRDYSTGVDLHECPVGRYRLEYEVRQLSINDRLFASPRSPSPDWTAHAGRTDSPGPNDSR